MSKKKVMRETTITICDYCGKEITDANYSGSVSTDYHSLKVGGEAGEVEKTCYDKALEIAETTGESK